jgi:hypothetical protein
MSGFEPLTTISSNAATITGVTGGRILQCSSYSIYLPVPVTCGFGGCSCPLKKMIVIVNEIFLTELPRLLASVNSITDMAGISRFGPIVPAVDTTLEARITALDNVITLFDASIAGLVGLLDDVTGHELDALEGIASKMYSIYDTIMKKLERVQVISEFLKEAVT